MVRSGRGLCRCRTSRRALRPHTSGRRALLGRADHAAPRSARDLAGSARPRPRRRRLPPGAEDPMMPDLDASLTLCTYCPKLCRHTCPVSNAEARETVIPGAKMATMRLARLGKLESDVESTASLYACTGCGACSEVCLHGVTPGRHLFTGRADAERTGHGHPALAGLPDRVRAHAEASARAAREVVPPHRFQPSAEVALLPGCDDPEATATTLTVCDRIGAEYVGVADVSLGCGGYPLLAGGFPDAFRLHAEALARQLQGYSRVVVPCPACVWAMRVEYPAHGVPLRPEVLHTSEFLAQFIERLPVAAAARPAAAAFYHDPCYLGRQLGIYDAPRRLLERAFPGGVREFSRTRGESECSGGGGVLPLTMPATADAITARRLEEVHEAGATEVITACATCKRRLTRDGVTARDLVDVLAEATRPA
ncbi:MAG: (Fe-S)-binding protein [Myxococcales bacterium]|nr:(Fe-S)-binding protein [Myxococcales bacterium]